MNNILIEKTTEKLIWTPLDIQQVLGIDYGSALVYLSRSMARKEWVRLKNGVYIPSYKYQKLTRLELFKIANFLQVPSYISLISALQFWGASTQLTQSAVESVSPVRAKIYPTPALDFRYFKIQKKYIFSIARENGIFIATPERALLDALYLEYFGKYSIDRLALEIKRFDVKLLQQYVKQYQKNQKLYDFLKNNLCKIFINMNNLK